MAEIKWIKITTNMFDDEKIKLIDAMPERDTIHYIWIRLLALAGKTNGDGFIFLSETMTYSEEMLATIFNRPINSVRLALKTLGEFEMINIYEDNLIKIANWEKHQNIEGMERVKEQNRLRKQRQRNEEKKQLETRVEEEKKQLEIRVEEEKIKLETRVEEEKIKLEPSIEEEKIKLEPSIEEEKETLSDGHVTVTVQRESKNKKENKNKNKNKKEEREREREIGDIEDIEDIEDIDRENLEINIEKLAAEDKGDKSKLEGIATNSLSLLKYYENITGIAHGLNLGALKVALKQHGYTYVKIAIDKALEVNKPNMTYINGILRNWAREGYPKEKGAKGNGGNIKANRTNKNEFTGFKIHESRSLTEQERKDAEQQLI